MNRSILIATALAALLAVGAYFLGQSRSPMRPPASFQLSSALTPQMDLVSAYADIAEVAEVCPQGSWMGFNGKGRVLILGQNRYHYGIQWDPARDLVASRVQDTDATRVPIYDLQATVRKVNVTMDPDIQLRGWVLEHTVLVQMNTELGLLKDAMLTRMRVAAENKLTTERTLFERALQAQLRSIYDGEAFAFKVRNVTVRYDKDAIPPHRTALFTEECPAGKRVN
jgi:hypothetical protein